jgi:hypothetical protein
MSLSDYTVGTHGAKQPAVSSRIIQSGMQVALAAASLAYRADDAVFPTLNFQRN